MLQNKFIKSLLILSPLILLSGILLYASTGTPSTLVVRTDANNYLLVTSVTQTNPVTQGVFSSRTLRTDSSGSLQVILTGTVTPTYPLSIPASTCAAPSLGEAGATTTGIAFTATPSILDCISGSAIITTTATAIQYSTAAIFGWSDLKFTRVASGSLALDNGSSSFSYIRFGPASTSGLRITTNLGSSLFDFVEGDDSDWASIRSKQSTAQNNSLVTTSTDGFTAQNGSAATVGTQVQISPRTRWVGTGWDVDDVVSRTVSFFAETLPVAGNTVSGTWKLGFIDPVSAAITYPLTVSSAGSLTTLGNISSGGFVKSSVDGSSGGFSGGTGGDVSFYRGAADTWYIATGDSLQMVAGAIGLNITPPASGMIGMTEQTAPSAPAANGATIYAVDNGAGKTQLCVIFNTGAAQCFATQP